MPLSPETISQALLQSLISSPLLIGDLPEANLFPRSELGIPGEIPALNPHQKLGHLYEDALALLIESSPSFELIGRSVQIQESIHKTLGELDYLIRCKPSGKVVHLELAVKFYLAVDTEEGMTLPGPDARDNYFNKLGKLRNHQLQLTKRYRDLLPGFLRNEDITSRQLIYGCLFDHVSSSQCTRPEFISDQCRRGKWLHLGEIPNHFPAGTSFRAVPKSLWPVPLEYLDETDLSLWNPEPTLARCQMVKIENDLTPYFIAPDGYPRAR